MTMLTKKGYGQVEPNHLSAQVTGQIYAQTPVEGSVKQLENGVFLKQDNKKGTLGVTGNGEWMLVYNEVKLYDNKRQGYKDFVVTAEETVREEIVPRVFKTNVGDKFTTNVLDLTAKDEVTEGDKFEIKEGNGDYAGVGVLTQTTTEVSGIVFEAEKVYTMPDGQKGVKVVRVQ